MAGLLVFHPVIHGRLGLISQEVVGHAFGVVGVLYGILLAFVVFAVWEQFTSASLAVTGEVAQIVVTFRDTQTLPPPLQQQAQQALRTFV